VVTADRDYHERMREASGPDAEQVPFPAFCPERRFALRDGQVLIGRRSRSRGIEPQIDLTGPPEDAAVSHAHAMLVPRDGGWAVVDLDSANGTYLNDGADPIAAHTPVPLASGDRIHVGAWTTLAVTANP
jgi:predicted component of type VI protein secretion system